MGKNNIDWQLQEKLRKPVFIEDTFSFNNTKIHFKISSEEGLIFYDEGINKYHNYGYIKNYKQKNIFYQSWIVNPLNPSCFFIHGNAENSSSHPKFFYFLFKNGINVFSFDQEGYGNSDGIRGTFDSFHDYIINLDLIYTHFFKKLTFLRKGMNNLKGKKKKKVKLEYPEFYFFGFSMGGLQTLYYVYLYNCLSKKLNLFKFHQKKNLINYNKIFSIKKIFLLNPWLSNHPRLISPLNYFLLKNFKFLFSKNKLLRQDAQRLLLDDNRKKVEELYLKMYKNLTDNKKYLIRRAKDTRIHRLVSKYWLSDIAQKQIKLKKLIKNKKFFNTYFSNYNKETIYKPEFYIFLSKNDIIVNNIYTENLFKNSFFNYSIYWLENFYHDFLDYDNNKFNTFAKHLSNAINFSFVY